MKQNRYPGVKPFERDQRALFFGRDKDIDDLYDLILLEKLVTLFGRSGYGKSSLLNAGVLPRFEEVPVDSAEYFLPITIKFGAYDKDHNTRPPLQTILQKLDGKFKPAPENAFLDQLSESSNLWLEFKKRQTQKCKKFLLVFDQFEELFTYPLKDQEAFKKELAELLYSAIPQRIRDAAEHLTDEAYDRLVSRMEIKTVFAIRSDQLSNLDQLKDALPAILKVRFELKPLQIDQARSAIVKPAALPHTEELSFYTDSFAYTENTLNTVLDNLSGGHTGEQPSVEAFQLQIICQYIERSVRNGKIVQRNQEGQLLVTADKLPNMTNIYQEYYHQQIELLEENEREAAKIIIEEGLLMVNEETGEVRRLSVDGDALIDRYRDSGADENLLNGLVDTFLLRRAQNTTGGYNYEISHDTLMSPIADSRKDRRVALEKLENEQKRIAAENKAREEAEKRQEAERLQKAAEDGKRRAQIYLRIAVGLLIIAFFSIVFAQNYLQEVTKLKASAELTAQAIDIRNYDKTLALRLSHEACKISENKSLPALKTRRDILSDLQNLYYKRRFQGHEDRIYSLAFSPDGQSIVTGSVDGIVKLWSLDGRELISFQADTSFIISVAFSPDGQSILTGGGDYTAKLWSLEGQELETYLGHEDDITSVSFSPDGQTVVTASSDGTSKLWSLEGQELQNFRVHEYGVNSVAFSPDGQSIVTGSLNDTVKLWSLDGRELMKFQADTSFIYSIVFSPDGQSILTGGGEGVAKLWSQEGKKLQSFQPHESYITSVAFSPDGQSIAASSREGIVKLWSLDGRELYAFQGDKSNITSVVFSPDGQSILTGGDDKTAKLWPLDGKKLQSFEADKYFVNSVAFSPDGQSVLTGGLEGIAKLWSLEGQELQSFQGLESEINCVTFSPDGQSVVAGGENGTAKLWSLEGQELQSFEGHESEINSVVFSPDGQTFMTGSDDRTVKLWSLDGQELKGFEVHESYVTCLAFSPDGRTILIGGLYDSTKLWSLKGRELQSFHGHESYITSVVFSPDGQTVLTGSNDNTAILWSLNGKELQSFEGHELFVNSVAFSPDGQTILTGSSDQTAKLWSLDGKVVQNFQGHESFVKSVAFSPDRQTILTGSSDKTVKLWPNMYYQLVHGDRIARLSEAQRKQYGLEEE